MLAPPTSKRAVVALWCLAAAAGCARVTEEAASDAPAPRAPITVPDPLPAAAREDDSRTPEPVPPAPGPSIADVRPEAALPSSPTAMTELPPSPAAAEPPRSALEPAVVVPAAPAAPAAHGIEREPDLTASAASPVDTLDLASLQTRLRKTKAISLRTKLAVKKESEELLERFRAYHAEHGTATLPELRRSYDSLFRKLYSLLEDADPPLARDIDRSRADIWAILADPIRFGASAASASTRGSPQA